MEYKSVKEKLSGVTKYESCNYNNFKDGHRYTIGKYAAIQGTAAVLRKFKKLLPHYRLHENRVRAKRENYYRIVKSASLSSSSSSSSPIKRLTLLKRGRPLLLGSLDEKVQNFLVALRSKGGVVNTIVVVTLAKALMEKSSDASLKVLDLDNSSLAKSLFVIMDFVKTACTTSRDSRRCPEGS